ncbi:BatA domain-containing protein [Thalassotalea sp. PS06]|uniref:BatA domain-containing protein n=1 Tax=Thalassotalea sp. PS06 TaxID=2594005 RepID=UPI0011635001|nr:BatA domain-containing protein [Thalassotalea sp. PS06]QDP01466.1 hypothetical protein FNC98_09055 [Thalassotalea sp. PS06]
MVAFELFNLYWPQLLLGIFALAIPIWIHWFTQQKPKTQAFSQLNLLPDTKPLARQHIQLQEKWLFVLRSLLVFVTVLLLAGMFFNDSKPKFFPKDVHLLSVDYLQQSSAADIETLAEQMRNTQSMAFLLNPGFNNISETSLRQLAEAKTNNDDKAWLEDYRQQANIGTNHPDAHPDKYPANHWQGIVNFIEALQSQKQYAEVETITLYASRQLEYYRQQLEPVDIAVQLNWQFVEPASAKDSLASLTASTEKQVVIIADESRNIHAQLLRAALGQIDKAGLGTIQVELIVPSQWQDLVDKSDAVSGIIYLPALGKQGAGNNDSIYGIVDSLADILADDGFLLLEDAIGSSTQANTMSFTELSLEQQKSQFTGMLLEDVQVKKRLSDDGNGSLFDEYQQINHFQQNVWQLGETTLLRISDVALTKTSEEGAGVYQDRINLWQFNSRFHPEWSGILEQRQLPHLLYFLMFNQRIQQNFNQNYLLPEPWFQRLNQPATLDNKAVNAESQATEEFASLATAIAKQQTQQLNASQKSQFQYWQDILAWMFALLLISERLFSEWRVRRSVKPEEANYDAL